MLNPEERTKLKKQISTLKKQFPTMDKARNYLINQGFVQPQKWQDNYFRLRQIGAYVYRLRGETDMRWLITYIAEPETGLRITKCQRGEADGARPLRLFGEYGV